MDLATLSSVLQMATSQNPEERKLGEDRLVQYQFVPGYLVALMQIIASPQIDISVRQVASICFKNLIAQKWGDSEEGTGGVLLPQDKAMIRDHILEAVTFAPPIIRSQLGECLKSIILNDYPSEWENLLPLIDSNLKSQDTQRIHGALFALRILARKFEFKDDEERVPIHKIIETTFPVILPLFTYLLSLQDSSVEIADLMKLICKIFWSSTYLEIPKYLQDSTNFMAWMTCLHTLIERPVPTEGQPVDPELRKTWAWWKLKKWTLHIIDRLFTRFGDPKCAKKCDKVFATMFQKHCAGKFLESHLSLLSCLRQGGYLPERVINFALKYLATSVGKAATYQLLKPHLDIILYEIVFPLLCFNDEDEALWQNDPHEYVRKGYDIIEDLYGARTAAINFLSELMRKRGKDNLQRFLNFIVDVFRRCQELPLDQKPYRQKDGALLAIGALSDILKKTDPYKGALESMLVQHVLPEFQSPLGHLRAKAAWVCGQYGMIKFADSRNFTAAMHCVVNGLRDPELPVRVDSVVALREFVIACEDLNELRPILPNLLDEFFKLMNEVENDDLVYTLERIVDKFGEEIAPYALGLCQNLGSAFWKCLKTSEAGDDDEDMGALAAVGCLQAISAILESIGSLPHLFPQLEPTLLPILKKMLTTDGEEVYEEVLQILTYLTYITPTISQGLWDLWPLLMEAMDEWAVDNFEYIINPIDNYISRGTEVFLSCKEPNYPQSLFKMITQVLENENLRDNDCIPAPKLLEAVLQNCKGRVDEWVEPYVQLAVTRLRRTEKPLMKDLLIQVVANALYYNPALCMNVLQKNQYVGEVFEKWFEMIYATEKTGKCPHFRSEHGKKVCILGLASMLTLPAEMLPPEVQRGMEQVMKGLLKLLLALKDQQAERDNEEEEEDEDDKDDSDYDEELGDDEDDTTEEDGEMLEKLTEANTHSWNPDDSDDEDSTDVDFTSPIDDVDPFIFFADTMKAISASDLRRFQALTGMLDFQHQAIAHGIEQHANVRRAEIEKERQQRFTEAAGGGSVQCS